MIRLPLTAILRDKQTFRHYVDVHNQAYRVHSDSRDDYLSLMRQHDKAKRYSDLVNDDTYLQLTYLTLERWNMNQRGARLVAMSDFAESIRRNHEPFEKLSRYRLEQISEGEIEKDILPRLRLLFTSLRVMATRARIVGLSKTLHFMLPNLVMPIDRGNIISVLYLGSKYSSSPDKEFGYFTEIFHEYWHACGVLSLSESDVDHVGWNTSIPKMIDNAVIGFLTELLKGNIRPS